MQNITKQKAINKITELEKSLLQVHTTLWNIASNNQSEIEASSLLHQLRFKKIFKDPISKKPQNFIETINQTYTYIITFKAIVFLYESNIVLPTDTFDVNIGSESGVDLKTTSNQLVAEVFTATKPSGNSKLKKDIIKVHKEALRINSSSLPKQFVFFYSPNIKEGKYQSWTIKDDKKNDITAQYSHVEVYCLNIF